MSLAVIRAALRALSRTGLLGAHPFRAILCLVWVLLRCGCSLFTLVAWNARRFPDAVAVVDPHRRATFRQLERRALQMAQALGLGAHHRVSILCRNSLVFVEALLACGRAGADAVLLSTTFAVEQVTHLCESERLNLLICDDEFRPQVTTLEARFPGLKGRVVSAAALANENLSELPRLGRPAPLRGLVRKAGAVVIMTSGTTRPGPGCSAPPHSAPDPSHRDRALGPASAQTRGAHLADDSFAAWTRPSNPGNESRLGRSLVCFSAGACRRPADLHRTEPIRVVVLVPTILHRLLEAGIEGGTTSVRQVICGSAPLTGQPGHAGN